MKRKILINSLLFLPIFLGSLYSQSVRMQSVTAPHIGIIFEMGAHCRWENERLKIDELMPETVLNRLDKNVLAEVGDIITSINETKITEMSDFKKIYNNAKEGDEISLVIKRGSEEKSVKFKRNASTVTDQTSESRVIKGQGGTYFTGGTMIREIYSLISMKDGNLTVLFKQDSNLLEEYKKVDIQSNDIFLEINGKKISEKTDFLGIYENIKAGEQIKLLVKRAEKTFNVEFKKGSREELIDKNPRVIKMDDITIK